MAFEFIPIILFGVLFLAVGLRLSNVGAFGMLKLALILGGIILIGWGLFAFWAEISSSL